MAASSPAPEAARLDLTNVKSSNLQAIGYDGRRQLLSIQFKGGAIFNYAGVAPDTVQQMFGAESIGRFYAQEIRGKYAAEKMSGQCPVCRAHGWKGDLCVEGCVWEGQRCVYVLETRRQKETA